MMKSSSVDDLNETILRDLPSTELVPWYTTSMCKIMIVFLSSAVTIFTLLFYCSIHGCFKYV